MKVVVLGAGCEVGRSCVILEHEGKQVMFDCGLHPALSGVGALPVFEAISIEKVNLCLVTHFHLDHCGAVPYLVGKTSFKGTIVMTEPTRVICRLMWADYEKMGKTLQGQTKIGEEGYAMDELITGSGLFNSEDVKKAFEMIRTIDFHEEIEIDGIKLTCYGAGHVLGACMFMVEIGGIRVLYTGDYSSEQDRHVPKAEIPPIDVHLLICESTYGTRIHDERTQRETRLIRSILNAVDNGGKCLLPVFALGRAQEILLILEEYWKANRRLHRVPIFYISPLSSKALKVYETFIGVCGEHIKRRVQQGENPYHFTHIKYAPTVDSVRSHLLRDAPCVIMTSPGMLQGGPSRDVFEIIAPDNRNGVILTGYTVKGTLADELKKEPDVIKLEDNIIKRRCFIEQISFSAHADYNQTRDFIDNLQVPNVLLVHGERKEMKRLHDKLLEDRPNLSVFMPEILQSVTFNFKRESRLLAVGKLAKELPALCEEGKTVEATVLCSGDIKRVMYKSELPEYFSDTCFVEEELSVEFPYSMAQLRSSLDTIFESLEDLNIDGTECLIICERVKATIIDNTLKLTFKSNPLSDMIADVTTIAAMGINRLTRPSLDSRIDYDKFFKTVLIYLSEMFGTLYTIDEKFIDPNSYIESIAVKKDYWFTIDTNSLPDPKSLIIVEITDIASGTSIICAINISDRKVICDDLETKDRILGVLKRVQMALLPVSL
ncbi:cleavage and polyadenylation specificity factor subunit 3 [Babesia microti strain RI]|uniref:Cleavage and polyadenylation specificity factor subunit 3 n=1 Tax=Babesia microti (strain RI) TaxID=1133968 RepID=A0A1N6LWN1_BABMR|nr:cleavage and polyadenylation specificity factor subunit 3 [Babesia microti strain RI]SIO73291.1 cleavage and polyadenylation specificity factor subunit 3 [Babesia microti strain RI]|eukprot:XP_021337395.1 cleavage and polyadenylation specificity factor subunit 3 [Babesia microti strain RI]